MIRRSFDGVLNGRVRTAARKFPGPLTESIGPRKHDLTASPGTGLVGGEALNNCDSTFDICPQGRAHFGDNGSLIAVSNGDLFAGRQRHVVGTLFVGP